MTVGVRELVLFAMRLQNDKTRKWLVRLGAILLGLLAVLWLLGQKRKASTEREVDEFELEASRLKRRENQRLLHITGRDRVGKSAVANALYGGEFFGGDHHPGTAAEYRDDFWLHELPGAAVRLHDTSLLDAHLKPGDVVVLVVEEQLLRADRRFLETLGDSFPMVRPLVLINKADVLKEQFTTEELDELRQSVYQSVEEHLRSPEDVVWGAASGPGGPELDTFQARLNEVLDELMGESPAAE